MRWLIELVTLGGLASAGLSGLALALLIVPHLPGRLSYYGLVVAGRAPGVAAGAIAGCGLCAGAALQPGRLRWLARLGLGLNAVAAAVFIAVTVSTSRLGTSVGWLRRVALPDVPSFNGVTIADGLSADVYAPEHDRHPAQLRPAILVIHGGGWTGGDKGDHQPWNRWLAARGCVVVDAQYRLAPNAGWREAVADIERGLAWVRAHAADLRVDPDRLFLLGRSAGGHLALLAAYTTTAQPPHRVIALYAPSDLGRLYAQRRRLRPNLEALVRNTPATAPDEYRLASPITRAHPGAPPTLLIHGAWDDGIPPDHSRLLAQQLARLGVPHQYLEVPYARHAFDLDPAGLASHVALEAVTRFCLES